MSVEMVFKANAQWARGRGVEVPSSLNGIMRDDKWKFIPGTNKRYDIHPSGAIRSYISVQKEQDGKEYPNFILGNSKGAYNKRTKLFIGYVSLQTDTEIKQYKRAELVTDVFGIDYLANFRKTAEELPRERTAFALNELPLGDESRDTDLVNQEKPKETTTEETKNPLELSSAELMLIVKIQRGDFEDGEHSLLEKREYKSLVEKGYLSFKTEVTDKKI